MQTQEPSPVTYRVQDAVATITMTTASLAAPAKAALRAAVERAAADADVRAVVLTGSGRVFCAGQDLGEHAAALAEPGRDPFETIDEHYNPVVTALTTMAKPVVAAVNGSCAGAGLGLALACDLRIASESARFTTAFTAIGLTPDSGLSLTLQRAVGAARAAELVLLSEPFTAADALAWGIVGRVVAADELPGAAQQLGVRLADGPSRAYATAKAALRQASTMTLPEALAAERRDQSALGATTDHREAVEAFLAKRRPAFRDGR